MQILDFETVQSLVEQAMKDGLGPRRDALLAPLSSEFVALLPQNGSPAEQLILDISTMNDRDIVVAGDAPLRLWLRQAALLTSIRPNSQRFYNKLAEWVAAIVTGAGGTVGGPRAEPDVPLPERIIHRDDLLPIAFLAGAAATARAVARITLPQLERDIPRLNDSGAPKKAHGTAWMIGPQHVLTNRHVIEARGPGEPSPAEADVRAQCAAAVVEFGFDQDGAVTDDKAVAALEHSDARLDYAVLKLAAAPEIPPLPVLASMPDLDPSDPFAVNIVQHPNGLAKHIALRNNIVAAIRGTMLAYYADTDGGSSGAPVCDDRWRVIALHRGASDRFGVKNFQGKTTTWVNVGTQIGVVIADLQANAPDVWRRMDATVV